MARNSAKEGLVPISLEPGRIHDFVMGMREDAENRNKTALATAGVYFGIQSWSAFKKYMRDH